MTTTIERTVTVHVARYSPERHHEGQNFATYEVPLRPKWMVLDALNHIRWELDPTLTYRHSCRMAVCGSCGMMLNGESLPFRQRLSSGLLNRGSGTGDKPVPDEP